MRDFAAVDIHGASLYEPCISELWVGMADIFVTPLQWRHLFIDASVLICVIHTSLAFFCERDATSLAGASPARLILAMRVTTMRDITAGLQLQQGINSNRDSGDRQTERTDRQTDKGTDRQTDRLADKQTGRQASRQIGGQTET